MARNNNNISAFITSKLSKTISSEDEFLFLALKNEHINFFDDLPHIEVTKFENNVIALCCKKFSVLSAKKSLANYNYLYVESTDLVNFYISTNYYSSDYWNLSLNDENIDALFPITIARKRNSIIGFMQNRVKLSAPKPCISSLIKLIDVPKNYEK